LAEALGVANMRDAIEGTPWVLGSSQVNCMSAHLLVFEDAMPRSHNERAERWSAWTELGNAPSTHAAALRELRGVRDSARYAQSPLSLSPERVAELLRIVDEMVAEAVEAAADRRT
jgi:hypothetical protein